MSCTPQSLEMWPAAHAAYAEFLVDRMYRPLFKAPSLIWYVLTFNQVRT